MKIKIEDILPSAPTFYISKKDLLVTIRPPNMLDQVWFKEKFGNDGGAKLQKILNELDWQEISRVVYHQLDQETRAHFKATKAISVDDNGEEKEIAISGPDHLLVSLSGVEECLEMLKALVKAITLSNPMAEELINEELKKNLKMVEMLPQKMKKTIGAKSSTRYRVNTGGRKKK